jgi:dnd system-associated protein 4
MTEPKRQAGDRFFVQKDKHHIFQKLSQGDDAPFKQMKEVWVLAAAMGFAAKRKVPLPRGNTQHVGFWHYLSPQEDIPLLQAIAVSDAGDVEVLGSVSDVIRIAEAYANGGIDLLLDNERTDRQSTLLAIAASIVESQED